MSNTRRAQPGTPLRQERWCSSEEFERGLLANIVARRCEVIERPEDRELIYFLQKLSHQLGGLHKAAVDLVAMFPDRLGTKSMQRFGMKPWQVYNAQQVKAIRGEIRWELTGEGPELELYGDPPRGISESDLAARDREWDYQPLEDSRPAAYRLEAILDRNLVVTNMLPDFLEELCLNPSVKIADGAPWYFPDLIQSLREFQTARIQASRDSTVVTEIGSLICDSLDYALEGKCLALVAGLARIGKTFAAKAWCNEHPGRARYVQVPSTNDDIGFLRAIANSLGIATGLSLKASELRQRVENTLQAGDLILVLDEAHYLWPMGDCRHTLPSRINWVMTALVNSGVPVALLTTPQFLRSQKEVEKRTHWTSEQFTGRIGHYQPLPDSLGEQDLAKVARALLPEGDSKAIDLLVTYAQASAKYLAGIESAVRRARYLARKEHRERVLCADIKRAIKEGVIPSDSALAQALAEPRRGTRKRDAMSLQGRFTEPAGRPDQAGDGEATRPDFAGIEPAEQTGRNRLNLPQTVRELAPA